MSIAQRIQQQFEGSIETKQKALATMAVPIEAAINLMVASLKAEGKIMACGNGGSAGDSQHFAAELINRFEREREVLQGVERVRVLIPEDADPGL